MENGIVTYKDLAEIISYIITSFSLIGLWIAYVLSKKQIHFTAMDKCINNYRNWMKFSDSPLDEIALEYIELVNEEFFYLENNYLPIEVCEEWIDGMIGFLPFYTNDNEFIKSNLLEGLENEEWTNNILYEYPRVFKAIKLKKEIDFEKIKLGIIDKDNREIRKREREKLIYQIMTNLNISLSMRLRLKIRFLLNKLRF
jgi:hypothetical protein